jgi:hypothetical protein
MPWSITKVYVVMVRIDLSISRLGFHRFVSGHAVDIINDYLGVRNEQKNTFVGNSNVNARSNFSK